MTNRQKNDDRIPSPEQRQADFAPETRNDEQDNHRSQAQEVARQARDRTTAAGSPTESRKDSSTNDPMGDSTQDLVDYMRDMESSGRIDMDAFSGEPNHDDNVDEFGPEGKVDDLRGDGT